MPTADQLRQKRQKAEEEELLNITGYVSRAVAKGKARREAIERGEILNESPPQVHSIRKRLANILREQGLTSAALPPTHPPYKPQPTMANMLVKQGLTAARNARAAATAKTPAVGGTRRRGSKQRTSRKRATRKAY